jgi:hypothetical protein
MFHGPSQADFFEQKTNKNSSKKPAPGHGAAACVHFALKLRR